MSSSIITNVRHAFFLLAGAIALVLTWPFAFDWMAAGGNILNPAQFFGDAMAPGGTAAFLSIDMLIAWIVFMVWVVFDAKRIDLGYKWGLFFVVLSYIGVSMAFPVTWSPANAFWTSKISGRLRGRRPPECSRGSRGSWVWPIERELTVLGHPSDDLASGGEPELGQDVLDMAFCGAW